MSHGLRVWNSGGQLILDTTHRCGRIMGSFWTGTSNGGTTISTPGTTVLWASLVSPGPSAGSSDNGSPGLYVSGNTVYWTFPSGGTPASSLVVYGCW